MKIAVLTAIFGGKDTPKPFPAQSVPCDYFCFTEENTPVPLPNLPDRLKAKYFKLQAHRVLPGYDAYVWIDGNIEVKSSEFVAKMVECFEYDEIAIQRHHERKTIGEEIDFIAASENPYLTTRYSREMLQDEYKFYLKSGMPAHAPLYSCNIFAWDNSDYQHPSPADFFDEWWNLALAWTWFDQSAFSFLMWKHWKDFEIVWQLDLGPMFDNPYFTLHSHTKPLG